MLKITEKITRYDIENLTKRDYLILKSLISSNGHKGLPPIDFAHKVLEKNDILMIYQITEDYLNSYLEGLNKELKK